MDGAVARFHVVVTEKDSIGGRTALIVNTFGERLRKRERKDSGKERIENSHL